MVAMGLGLLRSHFERDPDGRSRVSQQPPAATTWPRPYYPQLLPAMTEPDWVLRLAILAQCGPLKWAIFVLGNTTGLAKPFSELHSVLASFYPMPLLCSFLSQVTLCITVRVSSYAIALYSLQVWLPRTLLHVLFFHGVCFSWHLKCCNHQCYSVLVFISFQKGIFFLQVHCTLNLMSAKQLLIFKVFM